MSLWLGHTQMKILPLLQHGPRTTTGVRQELDITADMAHSSLRRLEDRNYVRRVDSGNSRASLWELTHDGRWALRIVEVDSRV